MEETIYQLVVTDLEGEIAVLDKDLSLEQAEILKEQYGWIFPACMPVSIVEMTKFN